MCMKIISLFSSFLIRMMAVYNYHMTSFEQFLKKERDTNRNEKKKKEKIQRFCIGVHETCANQAQYQLLGNILSEHQHGYDRLDLQVSTLVAMLPGSPNIVPLELRSKGSSGERMMVLQSNSPSLRGLRPSYSPTPLPPPTEWDPHLPSFEFGFGLGARAQESTVGLSFGLGWGPFSSAAYLLDSYASRKERDA